MAEPMRTIRGAAPLQFRLVEILSTLFSVIDDMANVMPNLGGDLPY